MSKNKNETHKKDAIKKTPKPKKEQKPKTPVITAYLMNGDKMELFARKTTLEDVQIAAANKLDPKRFSPEIIVLRDGKELKDERKKIEPGVLHAVAVDAPRDVDFWIQVLKVVGVRGDIQGAERALAEMGPDARNTILLRSASIENWLPQEVFSIEFLIKNGADVNAVDENGITSLAIATKKRFASAVTELIKHGADTSFVYERGMSPLKVLAIWTWQWPPPCVGERQKRNIHIIEILLKSKIDINAQGPNSISCLCDAAYLGRAHVVKMMLNHGADVNATIVESYPALGHALIGASSYLSQPYLEQMEYDLMKTEYEKTIELLVDARADLNGIRINGAWLVEARQYLRMAWKSGNADIVTMLAQYGADTSFAYEDGMSALKDMAIQAWEAPVRVRPGYATIIQFFAKNFGIDIISQGPKKRPFLPKATFLGYADVVELMLKHGAYVAAAKVAGYAVATNPVSRRTRDEQQADFEKTIKLLIDAHVDVNGLQPDGSTYLHWASEYGNKGVVELLLKNGAPVDMLDNRGRTSLSWASENDHTDVVSLLQSKFSCNVQEEDCVMDDPYM